MESLPALDSLRVAVGILDDHVGPASLVWKSPSSTDPELGIWGCAPSQYNANMS